MGVVYRATDTRLGREVAIKIGFEEFSDRFHREARAIAALNHPNVCTLHDIGSTPDVPAFLVMEFVEGDTLARKLEGKPLPLPVVLQIGRMMASALAAAHARGIVHRDLKPANVKITPEGVVKVLDFGLAKGFAAALADQPTDVATMAGTLLGTAGYMSPEQAAGKNTDARSDIFSFGIVLYEMLAGRRPFEGSSVPDVMAAILKDEPEPLRKTEPAVPEGLDRIVARCLRKNPEDRYASAAELHEDFAELIRQQDSHRVVSKRTMAVVASLLVVVTAGYFGAQSLRRQAQLRWLEETAVPEITRLLEEHRSLAALKLYREAERIAPESKLLFKLAAGVDVHQVQFETTPPGAKIYISDYTAAAGDDLSEWQFVGTTPVTFAGVPKWGYYRLRAVSDGFAPADYVFAGRRPVQLTLQEARTVPRGMVWIPEGPSGNPALALPGFWLDRYEVTNQQYKEFLDGGGYRKPEYWTEFSHVTPAAWEQAVARFHDQMNRPGPAGWMLGTYAEGRGNHPVAGVSWYEAAAFCRSLGKALPTLYEWRRAAPVPQEHGDIMLLSNFGARGTSPAHEHRGMAVFGAYNMAGNVKEWAANAVGSKRYALGGGWDEFSYVFVVNDARDPLDRFGNLGFRCVKRVADPPSASFAPVVSAERPVRVQEAVGETEFKFFSRLHQNYDSSKLLESRVDQTDDTLPFWTRLTVSFEPAYEGSRVVGHLFLPKDVQPPYQAIIMFGGSGVMQARRLDEVVFPFEFIVRSGRAVLIPAYWGTLERGPSDLGLPANEEVDRSLKWYWDLVRSVDYLDSREDIDIQRLGFYGVSWGAAHAPRFLAMDKRFKAAAFMSGGLLRVQPPEVDSWNFAPHYTVPTIMISSPVVTTTRDVEAMRRSHPCSGAGRRLCAKAHAYRHSIRISASPMRAKNKSSDDVRVFRRPSRAAGRCVPASAASTHAARDTRRCRQTATGTHRPA
jgi:hypothetical protein